MHKQNEQGDREDERPTTGPKGSIRIGAVSTSGRLKADQIDAVLKERMSKLESCYWGGLAKDPKLTGRVAVRFVIGRDRKTSNVKGDGDLTNGDVIECVVRVLNRAEYPVPEGGIVTVAVPLVLSP